MPRASRKKSLSGTYHIILRGINRQQIFEDNEDFNKFLQILKECKEVCGYKLYAYCLMGNHIHLLIREGNEPIALIMKRIANRFVYWYNVKYKRAGHLFQDRFRSEPINDDRFFLTVIRYIHQNPLKAGMCQHIGEYGYSSYNEYFKDSKLIDQELIFELVPKDDFADFNNEVANGDCLDIEENPKIKHTDEQALELIEEYSGCKNIYDFHSLDIVKRNMCIKKFKQCGLSIRQISRLTGVSFSVVKRI